MTGRGGGRVLRAYSLLVIAWLTLPVLVMVLFSVNDTRGRYNQSWNGFTLAWYGRIFERDELTRALVTSLLIALATMLVAGALGTGIGYALGRYRFRGSGVLDLVMFAAVACPDLVMGASLLTLFVSLGAGLGAVTIACAHVMFAISFVAVVVRARVLTLDRSLEEAAADLGAGRWTTFRRITLPLLAPAVSSGMLLAFALSLDDFVVAGFTAGTTTTFPLWIWGATRAGLPPQVNVMGTLLYLTGVLLAVSTAIRARPRRR
ncbi:ABC transporter permease [Couchioplanes caeruleus]|uniref:ABC transporter permease n=2 Tax=Couchioplanes caeruleus TaxID=56438 RepID=A0A1K0GFJ0_9ACTN|nr:ABC transporter permease [Couchioplanes caeruleus]OJF16034.1 ABC transporter permease [Couchioplanes caeruleus subsp. caeruleus]ROP27891.1 spermidine/putrescine transport system permease protein [Couchioplanes caeruleus]